MHKKHHRSKLMAMAAIVVVHTAITVAHGTAHTQAHVPLSAAATIFVFSVILFGPWIGLALTWWSKRLGAWLVAVTMAGALIFGFVNHFVLDSADHISRVDPQSRSLFAVTAVLLAVTEAVGFGLAIRAARR